MGSEDLRRRSFLVTPERPQVKSSSWLIQVYEMADLTAQQATVRLLSDMPGLTVDARSCDNGSYVIVECPDSAQAISLYEMVMMTDPNAELVHATTSSSEVQGVKARLAPDGLNASSVSDGDLMDA